MFLAISIFLSITSFVAWSNEKWLKLPTAVGVTLMSAVFSLIALMWHQYVNPLNDIVKFTSDWKFNDLFMHGALCFLLFASSLHVDIGMLKKEKGMILVLSTLGVILSALITGLTLYWVLPFFEIYWPLTWCLLFGVIASPTDAVIAADALKRATLPDRLKSKIIGESLFNDGMAVVLFSLILSFVVEIPINGFFKLSSNFIDNYYAQWAIYLLWQGFGAFAIGIAFGKLFLYAIRSINQPTIELLLTLTCATVTYALSDLIYTSAPIAVVFAGLVIGHHGKEDAMSESTQDRVFQFWELLDELINIGLFVLIGVQLLRITGINFLTFLIPIPFALFARYFSVAFPVYIGKTFRSFCPQSVTWMTWGGLRGGVSLALALSVPEFSGSSILLSMTYGLVVFSIVFQGGIILPYLSKKF